MNHDEQILEQIRNEIAELKQLRKELSGLETLKKQLVDMFNQLKADPNFSHQKCAVLLKDLEEQLKSCLNKKSGDSGDSDGKSGSVYERIFQNSPKIEKDKEKDESIRKKKSGSPLKPQM